MILSFILLIPETLVPTQMTPSSSSIIELIILFASPSLSEIVFMIDPPLFRTEIPPPDVPIQKLFLWSLQMQAIKSLASPEDLSTNFVFPFFNNTTPAPFVPIQSVPSSSNFKERIKFTFNNLRSAKPTILSSIIFNKPCKCVPKNISPFAFAAQA